MKYLIAIAISIGVGLVVSGISAALLVSLSWLTTWAVAAYGPGIGVAVWASVLVFWIAGAISFHWLYKERLKKPPA